jgi:carbon-monoxide dehydrogenase catalytic subunit
MGGSMIATEVSDILFGTPSPKPTSVNAGVLKKDQVNIIVHGHNPLVSEMILSTGAVEMMLVDYQCIMPSLGKKVSCYHSG